MGVVGFDYFLWNSLFCVSAGGFLGDLPGAGKGMHGLVRHIWVKAVDA